MKRISIIIGFISMCMAIYVIGGCAIHTGADKSDPLKRPTFQNDSAQMENDNVTKSQEEISPTIRDESSEAAPNESLPKNGDTIMGTKKSTPSGYDEFKSTQKILFDGARKGGKERSIPANQNAEEMLLNFEDADLSDVIQEFAKRLKINYMLDSSVNGKVNIHSTVPMDPEQLYPVFLQVLDANGLTAVPVGDLYQIGPSKEAGRLPLVSRIGSSTKGVGQGQRFIMQVVPLNYISCEQMSQLITPFISTDGKVITYTDTNVMIIVDKEINILKALKLVEVFDVDVFTKTNHAIYRLEYVEAAETAKIVQDLLSAYGAEIQQDTKIISVDRLNVLIVFGRKAKVFDAIASFLESLDVPTYNVEPQIYVYSVRNGRADELATLLQSVFSRGESQMKDKKPAALEEAPIAMQQEIGNPFEIPSAQKTKGEAVMAGSAIGSGSLKGEVTITADEVRNALIIEAAPSDFVIIEKILNKIDVLPRQVLIEVTIADVSLKDTTEFGIEWDYSAGKGTPSTSVLSAKMGSTGLNYVIGQTDRWTKTLNTLASKDRVNIIASPSILASDNKDATINISNEIPVATSQYEATSETNPILTTNIQYRNTGTILTVTPHINEFGLVSMDLSYELSEQSDGVNVGNSTLPSFFKRTVKTTLTVNNNQTIVIGGLIRNTRSRNTSGVPILKDIPLLKFLFGKINNTDDKTELVILITPRVIVNLQDVDAVTEEFKAKIQGITRYSAN